MAASRGLMPLPVAHTLAGAAVYIGLDADGRFSNWRRLLLVVFIVLLPDFDLIPGLLLGEPNRFHHGPSHSIAMVASGALLAAVAAAACCRWPLRRGLPQGAGGTALMVSSLLASHLLLDALNEDFRPPAGVPMFWPFSAVPVQIWPWFPHVNKLIGGGTPTDFVTSLLTAHNLWAMTVEAMTLIPIVALVAWWRVRSEHSRKEPPDDEAAA